MTEKEIAEEKVGFRLEESCCPEYDAATSVDFQWESGFGHFGMGYNPERALDEALAKDILRGLPAFTSSTTSEGLQAKGTLASITGSILEQLEQLDSSLLITQSSSEPKGDELEASMEMSICKSENLFSPMTEEDHPPPMAMSTFSTDSLDATRGELIANCMAHNRNNYTIAFEGSMTESTSNYNTAPDHSPSSIRPEMTNWRNSMGNNNGSSGEESTNNNNLRNALLLTQSCPQIKVKRSPGPVRIYDIQSSNSGRSTGSSGSEDRMLLGEDSWNTNKSSPIPFHLRAPSRSPRILKPSSSRSIEIQTSFSSNGSSGSNSGRPGGLKIRPATSSGKSDKKSPVYICFPNYTLPNLEFLSSPDVPEKGFYLLPQKFKGIPKSNVKTQEEEERVASTIGGVKMRRNGKPRGARPMSCNDIEELRRRDLSHVRHWESLKFLLPTEYKNALKELLGKPPDRREVGDEEEKEVDESAGRKDYTRNHRRATRRISDKFKRFSLQETLPEVDVAEITSEITKNLADLETITSTIGAPPQGNSFCDSADSGRNPPTNTPKQNNSIVDAFDNHFRVPNKGQEFKRQPVDLGEKQMLTDAVASGVNELVGAWERGGGPVMSASPCGKMVLDTLCPPLYSLLSDGLCPSLDTIFGRCPNTVWRVVEASIQYGPTAQSLNELVLKINSEDNLLAEGPMKFNAFICGLLNLGNLGSWLTFLRTKERLLRSHYEPGAFLFLCNTSTRLLYDQMLANSHLLSRIPFHLDIFHETKILHQSLQGTQKPRPTSVAINKGGSTKTSRKTDPRKEGKGLQTKSSKLHVNQQVKKSQMKRSFSDERPKGAIGGRPSTSTMPKSKTAQNIQNEQQRRLRAHPPGEEKGMAENCSTFGGLLGRPQRPRSIDNVSKEEERDAGERFRKLQMQWELLSSDEKAAERRGVTSPCAPTTPSLIHGSKIPRPITSPIRPTNPLQVGRSGYKR